ncbi:MAG TPA: hypothetical protein PKK10_13610 [Woeseiaceae bacterium]|nr:hypothetical protein [Woeseiaceae bacterium]
MHSITPLARPTILLTLLFCVAGCAQDAVPDEAVLPALPADVRAGTTSPAGTEASSCAESGSLRTTLYGALHGEVDWRGSEMTCNGMPRPNAAGARLRFSGKAGDNNLAVTFILALPDLEPGKTARELPSNLTIIEEGKGRFFNTANLDICLTDIEHQDALDTADHFRIEGTVYCIAPLAEVSGDTSVTINKLVFSGEINWSKH